MQLTGYVIEQGALAWCGGGDEGRFESLAEAHFDALADLERRLGLPAGAAEEALRAWVMDGRGAGPLGRAVLDAVLAADPRRRLEDVAWIPASADALRALDTALKANGLARNDGLTRLAPVLLGPTGSPISLDGAPLRLLPGRNFLTVENAWPAAVARLQGADAARAKALLAWWGQTKARHVDAAIRGQRADFDVLLVLA
jgi:hypothetical protein